MPDHHVALRKVRSIMCKWSEGEINDDDALSSITAAVVPTPSAISTTRPSTSEDAVSLSAAEFETTLRNISHGREVTCEWDLSRKGDVDDQVSSLAYLVAEWEEALAPALAGREVTCERGWARNHACSIDHSVERLTTIRRERRDAEGGER